MFNIGTQLCLHIPCDLPQGLWLLNFYLTAAFACTHKVGVKELKGILKKVLLESSAGSLALPFTSEGFGGDFEARAAS